MRELPAERVARMTPEMREKYEAKLRQVKRNRRIVTVSVATVAIITVLVILCTVVLFHINSISVKDAGSYYTAQEIISASGIDVGDNMLVTDYTKASERITQNLPYVKSVQFKKNLSGSVIITVKDAKPTFVFACENGYAITDDSLKTLELITEKTAKSAPTEIVFQNMPKAEPGKIVTVTDNEAALYAELMEKAKENGITDITKIDISDPANISVDVESRLRLEFGDHSDMDYKWKSAAKIIQSENETSEETVAVINLYVKGKVFVDPVDSLD